MIYTRLFTPLKVRNLELKNRIVMTALQTNFTPGGRASAQFNEFYWARAEGGVGLAIVGGARFDSHGAAGAGFMSLEDDSFIPGYRVFTDGMHARGAKVAVQLYHAGRYARARNLPQGEDALAPSALYCSYTHETAREITREEIKTVIRLWVEGAVRARKAGFDAVEIIGSAGYLIAQFLSPVANHRTDEYGGSWENRSRFPCEVIRAVRQAVGDDFPIFVRIGGNDFVPGSNTNAEAVTFAQLMVQNGADLISVTGGWHETRIPQLPGEVPPAGFTYLAEAVRAAVSVPVLASNRIAMPAVAEEVLALGRADCIGMARPLIADPEWPNKVLEGREKELRPCVACNQGCLASTFFGKSICCLVNGLAGRESHIKLSPTEHPKKILVVGGGPGGAECAIQLAKRGHDVTLWEQHDQLGGQLPLVAAPPGKEPFRALIAYDGEVLVRSGVHVCMGRRATRETVLAGDFDEIVVATGAVPRTMALPNDAGKIPVVTAAQVLSGAVIPGRDIVVVGGGAVGCETAQFLARRGSLSPEQLMFLTIWKAETAEAVDRLVNRSSRSIALVELTDKLGAGFDPGCAWPIMLDLRRLAVAQYPSTTVSAVLEHTVVLQTAGAERSTMELPCDMIVLAVGSTPVNELYQSLSDQGERVHLLGDAQKPRRVLDAVREALDLAAVL